MRESRRTERMHLPKDAGEDWLDSQKPKPQGKRHRNPPQDVYATWLDERVEKRQRKKAEK
jgi:hypothetical protein